MNIKEAMMGKAVSSSVSKGIDDLKKIFELMLKHDEFQAFMLKEILIELKVQGCNSIGIKRVEEDVRNDVNSAAEKSWEEINSTS